MITKNLADFNANVFVSQVQMSDTDELRFKVAAMHQAKACIKPSNMKVELQSEWMLGVYERELIARTQGLQFTPGG